MFDPNKCNIVTADMPKLDLGAALVIEHACNELHLDTEKAISAAEARHNVTRARIDAIKDWLEFCYLPADWSYLEIGHMALNCSMKFSS